MPHAATFPRMPELPPAPRWTVLDADFGTGQHFSHTLDEWRATPSAERPQTLHYVGIVPRDAERGTGFHRIVQDEAGIFLTLCVGEIAVVLRELHLEADIIRLAPADADTPWVIPLLARCCKRGTRLVMGDESFAFDPPWNIKKRHARPPAPPPSRCAVIGAGLCGAAVAYALALRGWQVTVFDQEAAPARAASGLPVGLAIPSISKDDNPRTQIIRRGIQFTREHAQRLLTHGIDWDTSGWIKPWRLVQSWLKHPAIHFVGNTAIQSLHRTEEGWQLAGAELNSVFSEVVVANAAECASLLASVLPFPLPVQALHGTMSYGTLAENIPGLPIQPINGHGSFVVNSAAAQWFAGSTFETNATAAADSTAQHALNMQRLHELFQQWNPDWVQQFEAEWGMNPAAALNRSPAIGQWTATRCVTPDRMPWVGGIADGLWLCVGMGSRGLSLAALCAEWLAAEIGQEPTPLEPKLGRLLNVQRLQERQKPPRR